MFTPEEKKLLEQYVTSSEDDVFAVRGMEGLVGAAYARYSRAKGGFRETLLKEFIKEGVVDPKHANELIERVLIAYGDDSVGELEGAHVSFENISMVATKEIEDRRIGGSPIEQSTRYVFYDQKIADVNGQEHFRYLRHPSVLNASFGKQYEETMDFIFGVYTSLIEPMKDYYSKLKPIESAEYDINGDGVKEKLSDLTEEKDKKAFQTTYTIDLRTKSCDTLRALLPLATLTNVGIFGNGRFFQGVISHLLTSDLPEAQDIAVKTTKAASELIPQYIRRARRNEYLVNIRRNMHELCKELGLKNETDLPEQLPQVKLLRQGSGMSDAMFAAMLFPYSTRSMSFLLEKVTGMNDEGKKQIINTYIGERKTRRDRPGRALEDGYPFTFELVTNWGVYKDLMRHRINTQWRQLFSTELGFDMPFEIVDAGFEEKALACVAKSNELFEAMRKEDPELAQYAVLHGNFVRWIMGMNAREAMHLIELRTTPQGHANYRKVAQMMHREISAFIPWIGEAMRFADHNDYYWSRADSEARQRVQEKKLDEKFGV